MSQDEPSPLQFWTAYYEANGVKHYLSNDKGGVRLFKDRDLLEAWLREKLTPEKFEQIVIHPVEGTFVVPALPDLPTPPKPTIIPITTIYPHVGPPTAEEMLSNLTGRSRKRHKPKGL